MTEVVHEPARQRGRRIHPAWWVAVATFLSVVCAAGVRSMPGVLIEPLNGEFGWSLGTISVAISINLVLFGLTAPFAAALMERFGVRQVVTAALLLVAVGSGLTVFVSAPWQLVLTWGVIIGTGTGSMALALVATVVGRWFVARRGLVSGLLTAASATGQLVFLPLIATLADRIGWRAAALAVAGAALLVVPFVLGLLRDRPSDLGLLPLGGTSADVLPPHRTGAARMAIGALTGAARTRPFWLLAGGFMICGATTNGLVQSHFVPAGADHGMPMTTAASLLALVGLFDLVGTVASGWLTDRFDPRLLLLAYYGLRGVSLAMLGPLFGAGLNASMLAFVIFYGLDWVATVPPTMALCREIFGPTSAVVFGWIYASHQIGAGIVALAAGLVRDHYGSYTPAWAGGAVLCVVGAVLSVLIKREPVRLSSVSP
ncbi:MAG TPA: MFS transporter [Pseudonocardia sp.]|nr:MFS transporter [Pseudonocardia sp.]